MSTLHRSCVVSRAGERAGVALQRVRSGLSGDAVTHPVKVWEEHKWIVFGTVLTGGRGVIDLRVDTRLVDADTSERLKALVAEAADDVETRLRRVRRVKYERTTT